MDIVWQLVIALGVPGAITGMVVWYLQKKLAASEKKRDEQQRNLESLVLMMLQSTRANSILCKATAEAVRDGHCNGNMTAAIAVVDKAAAAEKEFLLDKSIKYIFE